VPELASPYPLREGQGELIDYLEGSMVEGGICLAHAPTGIGKTLAALLAALPNIPSEGKLLYAVNRKNQIPIILKELRRINEANGRRYRATAFASKADLCRDPEVRKMGYRELIEACEIRRDNGSCPYYSALFAGRGAGDSTAAGSRANRRRSQTAQEIERRILDEMPPPHLVERLAGEVEEEMGGHPVCIYELLKFAAMSSEVLIGTFWYYFHPVVARSHMKSLSIERKDCVMICDEAHNLPKFCRDALSSALSQLRVRYAIREVARHRGDLTDMGISPEGVQDFLSKFSQIFDHFRFTKEGKHLPGGVARVFVRGKGVDAFEGPMESLEASASAVLESRVTQGLPPRSHLMITASFLRPFLLSNDPSFERFCVMASNPGGRPVKRLEIRCLDPAPLASSVLDPRQPGGVSAALLMSGTLVPGDYYKDILGIPSACHREFPNIFPRENRILFLDDSISLAWRSRNKETYGMVASRVKAIKEATPGGCMFFFPSYDVMETVMGQLPNEDILPERRGKTKRENVERALKRGRSVFAVMGATLGEGLDLPGLIKAVGIFGLPLERISDLVTLGMAYYDGKFPGKGRDYFYYLPAATKIIQSAGRAHRTQMDKAAIYVFDRRFCRSYLGSAPSWWSEEAIRSRDIDHMVRHTREFWSGEQG
jgi:DNA excision repair protein ERCC-2